MKGSRLLGFDSQFRPLFAVGRQSKESDEENKGVIYYPMQVAFGPHGSVVLNDQTRQPAQVWTHDGLYVGGFFDQRSEDGLHDGFYQVHGDDNQGATLVTNSNGETLWLMPYQGHNRLYEIEGWNNWKRQKGVVQLSREADSVSPQGKGLKARYYQGNELVLEEIEPPIDFEPFGAERHVNHVSPHYKAVWTGAVVPPFTDRYSFTALLGDKEQVAVWIEGKLIYARGFAEKDVDLSVELRSGERHSIHIEYINPDQRAELKLLWKSRVMDPSRIPTSRLFSE